MRLIDPKMSIDTIKSYIEVWDCKGCLPYGETQHNVMAVDDLPYLPTIEAEPVRHGQWNCIDEDGGVYRCSACGEEWYLEAGTPKENNMNYCMKCGAKMSL
jgi:DNA-directed RNA polymerase subunit RPC12/RpoP